MKKAYFLPLLLATIGTSCALYVCKAHGAGADWGAPDEQNTNSVNSGDTSNEVCNAMAKTTASTFANMLNCRPGCVASESGNKQEICLRDCGDINARAKSCGTTRQKRFTARNKVDGGKRHLKTSLSDSKGGLAGNCSQGGCLKAAEQENKNYRDGLVADRKDRGSAISGADRLARNPMANAENRMEDMASSPNAASRQIARNDQPIVLMAKQAVLGNGQFTEKDAQRARDPQVKRDLSVVAGFTSLSKEVSKTLPKLDEEIHNVDLNLAQLARDSASIASLPKDARGANEASARAGRDDSAEPTGESARGKKAPGAITDGIGQGSAGATGKLDSPTPANRTELASIPGSAPSLSTPSSEGVNAESSGSEAGAGLRSKTSLRDRLRAKLKEYDALKKGDATTDEALRFFERDLDPTADQEPGGRGVATSSGEALRAMLGDAQSSAMPTEEENARLGIVAGDVTETAALMKSQLEEQASGIAAADSEPIFARVHRYYVSWSARR